MAAGELAENRKRDRVKALAMRAMAVPLSVRTSDLPKRAASAVVMLALAGAALCTVLRWRPGMPRRSRNVDAASQRRGDSSARKLSPTKLGQKINNK